MSKEVSQAVTMFPELPEDIRKVIGELSDMDDEDVLEALEILSQYEREITKLFSRGNTKMKTKHTDIERI